MIDLGSTAELAGQTFTTSRGALQLWRRGNGPIVILLHDLATSHISFRGIVPQLLRRHHVCAVDLLGHGGSSRDVVDYSVTAQATAIAEMIDEMRLDRISVIGHALGGSTAIRLAAVLPERVQKVVLIAAGSYHVRPSFRCTLARIPLIWRGTELLGRNARRRCAAAITGRREEAALSGLSESSSITDRAGWKALGLAYRQALNAEAISEMEELVDRHLEQPTLAIWGSADRISPVSSAREVFQERRNFRLIEIAGGGHAPHEDHPDIVAELILDFLQ